MILSRLCPQVLGSLQHFLCNVGHTEVDLHGTRIQEQWIATATTRPSKMIAKLLVFLSCCTLQLPAIGSRHSVIKWGAATSVRSVGACSFWKQPKGHGGVLSVHLSSHRAHKHPLKRVLRLHVSAHCKPPNIISQWLSLALAPLGFYYLRPASNWFWTLTKTCQKIQMLKLC